MNNILVIVVENMILLFVVIVWLDLDVGLFEFERVVVVCIEFLMMLVLRCIWLLIIVFCCFRIVNWFVV